MKKLIAVVFAIMLAACGGAYDPSACFIAVKNKYSDSDVSMIPSEKFRFVVRKPNGEVIIVETMSLNDTKVTKEMVIFGANK